MGESLENFEGADCALIQVLPSVVFQLFVSAALVSSPGQREVATRLPVTLAVSVRELVLRL